MTITSTSPVILRPAYPQISQTSTPSSSNSSTPATSPSQSPFGVIVAPRRPGPPPTYFRANSYPQDNSLPKSKTNRLRRQEQQWQQTPSTTIQLPPWYTTERAHIQPLRLRIPHSNYTPQNQAHHQKQGKAKPPGALCLLANASPYPRA
ncbi:hypothetical protein BU23DRAFT_187739 [Bimuria novae-zelandiae CBS 107.79]|uniref:Uncharacterized protein n=1 Tax=Bimuria novae-zelandiae CBS 107.79 TaxID=1447943 RepID=A0A6A5VPT1_9PLEO|nr:hypothetical protein BU23DRAFT_187739 [Bimuria novae-zelandiae CBS 107.79]